jgi:hypothetical protein
MANDSFYLPTPAAASTTAYVPNSLNQYGSVAGQGATYDGNGNLLSWFSATGKNTYNYDSENRLISAAVAGGTTPTITYDFSSVRRLFGLLKQSYWESYCLFL